MGKKFFLFDWSSILYFIVYILYFMADYRDNALINFYSVIWFVIPFFILLICSIKIYKTQNKKTITFKFAILYILILFFYRFLVAYIIEWSSLSDFEFGIDYTLFDLGYFSYSLFNSKSMILLFLEIIGLNFLYEYFCLNKK